MSEIQLMAARPCGTCKGTGKHPIPQEEQHGPVTMGRCPDCDGTGTEVFKIPLSELRIRSREAAPGQPYISSPALRFMEIFSKREADDAEELPEIDGGLSRTAVVEASARQAARDRDDDELKVLFSAYVKETLEAWIQKKSATELEEALVKVEMAGDEMVRRARKRKP